MVSHQILRFRNKDCEMAFFVGQRKAISQATCSSNADKLSRCLWFLFPLRKRPFFAIRWTLSARLYGILNTDLCISITHFFAGRPSYFTQRPSTGNGACPSVSSDSGRWTGDRCERAWTAFAEWHQDRSVYGRFHWFALKRSHIRFCRFRFQRVQSRNSS